ncbi:hypothetical protein SCLCIDRAFT_325233 [Scleroderma citrinum Foug A]|uniref:Uncharacterized protein n=1 Tax=Scleroderma citrinum Foug A TaxID=1036808 RepID=A0A0C3EDT7_9AGAM|nr:hypothetical protein SCLCIDRAFT_325233 [Scleroderma citrinum Foug A]
MQRIHVDRPWARDRECLGGDDATWLFAIRRVGACPGGEYARRAASEAGRTSDLVWVIAIGVAALPILSSFAKYHSVVEGSLPGRRRGIGCRRRCRWSSSWRWW